VAAQDALEHLVAGEERKDRARVQQHHTASTPRADDVLSS
jgi:hypothetical protein